ncbi:MAG: hypothetical protein E7045_09640 [Lentisphaerae bacterium]|nr:hypothetical protein [Lentisphaerota bacterium]
MQELSPKEFQEILDENGEISPKYLSAEDREKISLANMIRNAKSAAGFRCMTCQGTGFCPVGGNITCSVCNGRGWK